MIQVVVLVSNDLYTCIFQMHKLDKCHILSLNLRHGLGLQSTDSEAEPGQIIPPFMGDGLSHNLNLVLTPEPHVTLQLVNELHVLHFPLTDGSI